MRNARFSLIVMYFLEKVLKCCWVRPAPLLAHTAQALATGRYPPQSGLNIPALLMAKSTRCKQILSDLFIFA